MLDWLRQDLRYAVRALRRSPGFSVAAVLTLALGIGANTAIFSVVDGVLLRPAPFEDPDRLMMVWETDRKSGTTREPASIPDYADFKRLSRRFERLGAFTAAEVSLNPDGGDPTRLAALAVTHDFLPLVGVRPIAGRLFREAEDAPGAPRVALISEALWTGLFARDGGAVGREIRINDVPHAVVGVLPAQADFGVHQVLGAAAYGRGFADRGGRARVDVWLPLRADPSRADRGNHPIFVAGRLSPDAGPQLAQEEMSRIAADLERLYPEANDARGVFVEPLSRVVFGPVRPAMLVLLGAVGLVLLIACGNVANLLLARGAARVREVTVRAALGASARRLTRQFLVESAVLTLCGAMLGVVLAAGGLDLLLALAPASLPRIDAVGVDLRVLAVTLALAGIVGLTVGLVPAVQARRLGLNLALQADPGRGLSSSRKHRRFRSALVVTEIAMTVMLMIGAGLLIRSLWRLQGVDPGFQAEGVLKAEFQLPPSRYPQSYQDFPAWPEARRFHAEVIRRLSALPGVQAAAIGGNHPLDAGFTSSIAVAGREAEARDWPEPAIRRIDAGYASTLGIPLLAGRPFSPSDDVSAPPVVLINDAARRRFFAGGDPLGQRIRLWGAERTVVGVMGDERFRGPASDAMPAVYLPTGQAPVTAGSILLRTAGDPSPLVPAVRGLVREVDPALPLFGVEPLRETLSNSMGQQRFTMLVLGSFAAVALLLAMIGVHGVLSYSVAQRTREIGIRIALGAGLGEVRSLVVGQGVVLVALGIGVGLLGALALARTLTALLYGVHPADPLTFVAVAVTLGVVAVGAGWLPARRATRVDPVVALRAE